MNQAFVNVFNRSLKPINFTRANKKHIIGIDVCWAIHKGFDELPEWKKAQDRLGVLLKRFEKYFGDRKPYSDAWLFSCCSDELEYRRIMKRIDRLVTEKIEEEGRKQDGIQWIIMMMIWGEECYEQARFRDDFTIAKFWRPIINILNALYLEYENEEWLEKSYERGCAFHVKLKRATGAW